MAVVVVQVCLHWGNIHVCSTYMYVCTSGEALFTSLKYYIKILTIDFFILVHVTYSVQTNIINDIVRFQMTGFSNHLRSHVGKFTFKLVS